MERVQGVGGVFFRAEDPEGLAAWYETHLGVDRSPSLGGGMPWRTGAGFCVFAPHPKGTDYFPADRQHMLNFRVADLAAMRAQLEASGIAVEDHGEMEGVGHFARIHDPEGNPIELWEPAEPPV